MFNDFYRKNRAENWPTTSRKSTQKPPPNLPEAFPEYPEIANKPARE